MARSKSAGPNSAMSFVTFFSSWTSLSSARCIAFARLFPNRTACFPSQCFDVPNTGSCFVPRMSPSSRLGAAMSFGISGTDSNAGADPMRLGFGLAIPFSNEVLLRGSAEEGGLRWVSRRSDAFVGLGDEVAEGALGAGVSPPRSTTGADVGLMVVIGRPHLRIVSLEKLRENGSQNLKS